VLLVFFIMMQSSRALAPVDVPDMSYAGTLKSNPTAITIVIDKASATDVSYSVRLGESVKPEHDNLKGPDARQKAIKAMQELFIDAQPPGEVRITCHKDLPSERVFEVMTDLMPYKETGSIAMINAEVHEKKQ